MRARIHIARGRLDEARRWQRDAKIVDEPGYLREYELLTLARLRLAEGEDVREMLDRLLAAAEAGGRVASVIEILVLQALAHQVRGDGSTAMIAMGRALVLAEPEQCARVFVDTGPAVAALLKAAARRGANAGYARQLLAGFDQQPDKPATHPDLIEPLSERELDVLRLLRSDLDGPDIARELRVTLNTMRTHTKNIYEKLGVNSRRSAVRRAEDLDLL
jgi:LuxR family maltose regulon positive regulatory protein